jgi:acetyltransferase-like isoleucine patch superfamily enzyme
MSTAGVQTNINVIPEKVLWRRILRAPITLPYVLTDRLLWPLCLRLRGVTCETKLTLEGLPIIRMAEEGEIRLSKNVRLFSRKHSNPIQLQTRCALILRRPKAKIKIGEDSALSGTVIVADSAVEIGERVLVGPNTLIIDTDGHSLSPELRRLDRGTFTRPIVIGNDVFIGTRATILKGTTLGDGCVVNAGSVVSGVFPPRSVVGGNPAKVVGQIPRLGDFAKR